MAEPRFPAADDLGRYRVPDSGIPAPGRRPVFPVSLPVPAAFEMPAVAPADAIPVAAVAKPGEARAADKHVPVCEPAPEAFDTAAVERLAAVAAVAGKPAAAADAAAYRHRCLRRVPAEVRRLAAAVLEGLRADYRRHDLFPGHKCPDSVQQ